MRQNFEKKDAASGDPPKRWADVNLLLLKYIDDFNEVDKLYKKSAILTLSQKNRGLSESINV